jgi:hypothetical protein
VVETWWARGRKQAWSCAVGVGRAEAAPAGLAQGKQVRATLVSDCEAGGASCCELGHGRVERAGAGRAIARGAGSWSKAGWGGGGRAGRGAGPEPSGGGRCLGWAEQAG